MLSKSLPFFQEKKNLNPNQQSQELPKNQSQNEALYKAGLNLLTSFQQSVFTPEYVVDFTAILRKFVIGISVFFGFLIFLNLGLSLILTSQKKQQAVLVSGISSFSDLEKTAKEIDSKTIYYKKLLSLRKKLSPKVQFLTEQLGSLVDIKELRITNDIFTVSAVSDGPYTFTKLISSLLEGKTISEISLKGANLNVVTGKFEVDMGGKFK